MTLILKSPSSHKSDNIDVYDDLRKAVTIFRAKKNKNEYIHQFPSLPLWTNKTYNYKGYEVNLYNFTCTCEEFNNNSKKYSGRDIRRACKHLYNKLIYTRVSNYVDELTKLMLKNVVIFNEEGFYKYKVKEITFHLGYKNNTPWINVYYDSINFSYNILEHRWRSNLPPPDDWKILYYINQLFGVKKEIIKLK